MQTAWKSGKRSDSRLVGSPDVLKVIENIGGACKRAEEDPRWETIYNTRTGLFQAGKINSPGSWLETYMKKHFHVRVDSDMNSPLNCRFKELFGGSASSEWVASMARERYANGPGRTIDRKTMKAVGMKIQQKRDSENIRGIRNDTQVPCNDCFCIREEETGGRLHIRE
jgi:hypothetical protein